MGHMYVAFSLPWEGEAVGKKAAGMSPRDDPAHTPLDPDGAALSFRYGVPLQYRYPGFACGAPSALT